VIPSALSALFLGARGARLLLGAPVFFRWSRLDGDARFDCTEACRAGAAGLPEVRVLSAGAQWKPSPPPRRGLSGPAIMRGESAAAPSRASNCLRCGPPSCPLTEFLSLSARFPRQRSVRHQFQMRSSPKVLALCCGTRIGSLARSGVSVLGTGGGQGAQSQEQASRLGRAQPLGEWQEHCSLPTGPGPHFGDRRPRVVIMPSASYYGARSREIEKRAKVEWPTSDKTGRRGGFFPRRRCAIVR